MRTVLITVGILSNLILMLTVISCMTGCQPANSKCSYERESAPDVIGFWRMTEGSQSLQDTMGNKRYDVIEYNDNVFLQIAQHNNIVDMFGCMGLLEKQDDGSHKALCYSDSYQYTSFGKARMMISGVLTFTTQKNEVSMDLTIEQHYPEMDSYKATTTLKGKAVMDKKMMDDYNSLDQTK